MGSLTMVRTEKNMKKTILILTAAASLAMHPIASCAGIVDDIDDIEQKIDDIDLDQSRDDIRSDLDDIKQALEDLKGGDPVYVPAPRPHKPEQGYTVTPVDPAPKAHLVTPDEKDPIVKPPQHKPKARAGYHYVWTESDNPNIGWHWLEVQNK
jgi:hypothetical protein